jgi:hypothetical protein
MSLKTAKRVPVEEAATPVEIRAAIEALTEADFQRLLGFARRRIWMIGPKAEGKAREDLLQEALQDLLSDTRRWNKTKVGFMQFMFGAMRSISSNWAKTCDLDNVPKQPAALKKKTDEGKPQESYEEFPDPSANAQRQIEFGQKIASIDSALANDQEAMQILEGWKDGMSSGDIRALWGFSQNDYNTIVRRLRRTLAAAGIAEGLSPRRTYVN